MQAATAERSDRLSAGTRLSGRFRIEEAIGQGDAAQVVRAIWLPHPHHAERMQGMVLVSAAAGRLACVTPALRRALALQLMQLT